jgi:hypothetical protein
MPASLTSPLAKGQTLDDRRPICANRGTFTEALLPRTEARHAYGDQLAPLNSSGNGRVMACSYCEQHTTD